MTGRRTTVIDKVEDVTTAELVGIMLFELYGSDDPPREVLVQELPDTSEVWIEWLAYRRDARVSLRVPQRGARCAAVDCDEGGDLLTAAIAEHRSNFNTRDAEGLLEFSDNTLPGRLELGVYSFSPHHHLDRIEAHRTRIRPGGGHVGGERRFLLHCSSRAAGPMAVRCWWHCWRVVQGETPRGVQRKGDAQPPSWGRQFSYGEQPETEGEPVTEEQRQWAIRRVRAKRGFWVHFAVYLAVNALLVLIWAMTSAAYFWPVWPMLGWGIGVVAHAVSVYVGPSEISEARIDRELQGRLGS